MFSWNLLDCPSFLDLSLIVTSGFKLLPNSRLRWCGKRYIRIIFHIHNTNIQLSLNMYSFGFNAVQYGTDPSNWFMSTAEKQQQLICLYKIYASHGKIFSLQSYFLLLRSDADWVSLSITNTSVTATLNIYTQRARNQITNPLTAWKTDTLFIVSNL